MVEKPCWLVCARTRPSLPPLLLRRCRSVPPLACPTPFPLSPFSRTHFLPALPLPALPLPPSPRARTYMSTVYVYDDNSRVRPLSNAARPESASPSAAAAPPANDPLRTRRPERLQLPTANPSEPLSENDVDLDPPVPTLGGRPPQYPARKRVPSPSPPPSPERRLPPSGSLTHTGTNNNNNNDNNGAGPLQHVNSHHKMLTRPRPRAQTPFPRRRGTESSHGIRALRAPREFLDDDKPELAPSPSATRSATRSHSGASGTGAGGSGAVRFGDNAETIGVHEAYTEVDENEDHTLQDVPGDDDDDDSGSVMDNGNGGKTSIAPMPPGIQPNPYPHFSSVGSTGASHVGGDPHHQAYLHQHLPFWLVPPTPQQIQQQQQQQFQQQQQQQVPPLFMPMDWRVPRAYTLTVGRGAYKTRSTWVSIVAHGATTPVATVRGGWAGSPPTLPAQVVGEHGKPRLYMHARLGRTESDVRIVVTDAANPVEGVLMTVIVPAALGALWWPPPRLVTVPPPPGLAGSVVSAACVQGTRVWVKKRKNKIKNNSGNNSNSNSSNPSKMPLHDSHVHNQQQYNDDDDDDDNGNGGDGGGGIMYNNDNDDDDDASMSHTVRSRRSRKGAPGGAMGRQPVLRVVTSHDGLREWIQTADGAELASVAHAVVPVATGMPAFARDGVPAQLFIHHGVDTAVVAAVVAARLWIYVLTGMCY